MPEALNSKQIETALEKLDGWAYEDDQLKKTFEFEDFREAISFLVRLAFHAEAQAHHPDLHNVYNTVDVALTTHDADNQVTQKDVDLAKAIDEFSWV